jgi:hypothetical protein
MLGKKLSSFNLKPKSFRHYGVKEAVFPFNMFPEVDPLLGPEMRSTGEVLGMAGSFGLAFFKAEEAAQQLLPSEGAVLITVSGRDRPAVLEVAKEFDRLGFKIKRPMGRINSWQNTGLSPKKFSRCMKDVPILSMRSRTMMSNWSSIPPAANQVSMTTPISARQRLSIRSLTLRPLPRPSLPPKALPPTGRGRGVSAPSRITMRIFIR